MKNMYNENSFTPITLNKNQILIQWNNLAKDLTPFIKTSAIIIASA